MKYQSFARITKTYHGVTFNPGDIKDVDGIINDSRFVRIKENKNKSESKEKSTEDDEHPVRRTQKSTKQNYQQKEDKTLEKAPVSDKSTKDVKSEVQEKEIVSE